MTDKNVIWNNAGKAGLILGTVSCAYVLCTMLTGMIKSDARIVGVLVGIATALLWAAKFFGCIYLMRALMHKFADDNQDADRQSVFKFGCRTALLSALIYSAFYLAYILFFAQDTMAELMDTLRDNPMMDSASLDALDEMAPKMPTYMFFANLVYCYLFGVVLSAIFSKSISPSNPFDEQ